jgi:polyhydroxyalkanoate synthesis repressor PhaR
MPEKEDVKAAPITIKKYANRRLYNTATSSYVTLDHLCQMVKDGLDFVVYDAKTGEDITRSVLTQIIVEEESKGQNLLPISFLRQLIGFYGDNMQWVVPRYLEYSMQAFSRNQEQMRDYFQNTLGGMFPFGTFEEMGKQNMVMFERAMRMFSPFATAENRAQEGDQPRPRATDGERALEEMQRQLEELQRQLVTITKPKKD